jgi:hypothetical protein
MTPRASSIPQFKPAMTGVGVGGIAAAGECAKHGHVETWPCPAMGIIVALSANFADRKRGGCLVCGDRFGKVKICVRAAGGSGSGDPGRGKIDPANTGLRAI